MQHSLLFFRSIAAVAFLILSNLAIADNLKIAVGLALPPYVLPESNTGIELDIVREALAANGHTITPVYLPFARVSLALAEKKVDAALTVNESSGLKNVYFSDSHITYQNVAVSLASNNFTIDSVADLKNRSVIAFQGATKYLGSEFAEIAAANSRYNERAKQSKQITMLFSKRVDSIVMDINIFKYFRNSEKNIDTTSSVTIHEIFQPSDYKVGFLKEGIRDEFNKALVELKKSGKYESIINSYIQ